MLSVGSAVGGLLTLSADACYVLEADSQLVGYALATADYKTFAQQLNSDWLPTLRARYKPGKEKTDQLSVTQVRACLKHLWRSGCSSASLYFRDLRLYMYPVWASHAYSKQLVKNRFKWSAELDIRK